MEDEDSTFHGSYEESIQALATNKLNDPGLLTKIAAESTKWYVPEIAAPSTRCDERHTTMTFAILTDVRAPFLLNRTGLCPLRYTDQRNFLAIPSRKESVCSRQSPYVCATWVN